MKSVIRIGYIGCGSRGRNILSECIGQMRDVEIPIICDLSERNLDNTVQILIKHGKAAPRTTKNWREVIEDDTLDAVMFMNGWENRAFMAAAAMRAGKYTAIEVGCAYDLRECWDLVDAYEETGVPLMMLENCCYGRREMMALNMVKQGLFGEIIHCDGGYMHNCRFVFAPKETDPDVPNFRLESMEGRNFHFYPTHDFGPISKVLSVNRGNRMMTLSSFASKARGLKTYIDGKFSDDDRYAGKEIRCGDIIDTIITCAGGETVHLRLDTTLPRPYYSRGFTVRGTHGMCTEDRRIVYLDGMEETMTENEPEFFETYDHPLHREYAALGERGSHGGMDWLVCRAFIEAVKRGENTPIDAYDTAAWMAIGPLSEQSIAHNGTPVDVPDFTRGKWLRREPITEGKYCLDAICEDPDTRIFDDID